MRLIRTREPVALTGCRRASARLAGAARAAALLLAAVCAAAPADQAATGAYECREDSVPTFSDGPCQGDAREVEIDYDRPSSADAEAAEDRLDTQQQRGELYAERIALQREIARSEGRISDLRKDRDEELARLQETKHDDEARPSQALWNERQSGRQASLAARYRDEIAAEERRLERLRRRLRRLEAAPQ